MEVDSRGAEEADGSVIRATHEALDTDSRLLSLGQLNPSLVVHGATVGQCGRSHSDASRSSIPDVRVASAEALQPSEIAAVAGTDVVQQDRLNPIPRALSWQGNASTSWPSRNLR